MNSAFKKSISILLIVSIMVPMVLFSTPAKKAQATWPVIDWPALPRTIYTGVMTGLTKVYTFISSQKETVLDPIAYMAAQVLIRQLTQSIVEWINSGFNGNPSFIQDPGQFLTNTADRAAGEFILGSDLAFLCEPFEIGIRINLGLNLGLSTSFRDSAGCTMSDVLRNANGSMKQAYYDFTSGDFINGGGWDSWLEITTQPQNNQLGAMILAQNELDRRMEEKKHETELEAQWGSGVMSYKECTEETTDAEGNLLAESRVYQGNDLTDPEGITETRYSGNGADDIYVTTNCTTVTPGSMINQQMQEATGSELKQLQLADEFNEIVGALANYMITSVMSDGLLGADKRQAAKTSVWRNDLARLQNEQNQNLANVYAESTAGLSAEDAISAQALFASSTKNNIIKTIQTQQGIEQSYQMSVLNILNLLIYSNPGSAYSSFEAKKSCAPLIQTNVLDKITGDTAYNTSDINRFVDSESLNQKVLEQMVVQSSTNVLTLNALTVRVNATSTNETEASDIASQTINNPIMHTKEDMDSFAVGGTRYNKIKNWLANMQNTYKGTGDACKADLSMWGI